MVQYKYLTYYQLYVVKSNYSRKGKRDTGGVHFMDSKAFFKLSYGVYIISTSADGRESGCVINTLTQVTSSPARLSIALNKENYTFKLIETSGTFSAVVLSDDVEMDLIRRFGFQCGKDVEKYDGIPHGRDSLHNPYPTEGVCARFTCRVVSSMDVGTHMIIVGEAVEAEVLDSQTPALTYSNYHLKKNGTTPPKAPSYQADTDKVTGWRCSVCGYILESETLPPDFICPVCGKDASYFVKL